MSVILDGLRHLARTTAATVLVIHHSRKAPSGSFGGAVLRGSSDLAAFAYVEHHIVDKALFVVARRADSLDAAMLERLRKEAR
jgi:hypothetical protein